MMHRLCSSLCLQNMFRAYLKTLSQRRHPRTLPRRRAATRHLSGKPLEQAACPAALDCMAPIQDVRRDDKMYANYLPLANKPKQPTGNRTYSRKNRLFRKGWGTPVAQGYAGAKAASVPLTCHFDNILTNRKHSDSSFTPYPRRTGTGEVFFLRIDKSPFQDILLLLW